MYTDNLYVERFWRSLKQEKIYLVILNTVKEAKNAITDYITFPGYAVDSTSYYM